MGVIVSILRFSDFLVVILLFLVFFSVSVCIFFRCFCILFFSFVVDISWVLIGILNRFVLVVVVVVVIFFGERIFKFWIFVVGFFCVIEFLYLNFVIFFFVFYVWVIVI